MKKSISNTKRITSGFTPLENEKALGCVTKNFLWRLLSCNCQKKRANFLTGFTLIELLVVISIIGLLSSVVFASLNTARMKARDAKNLSSLKQLQTALALYYDKFGSYPSGSGNDWQGDHAAFGTVLNSLVTNGFISKIPHVDNYPNNDWPYAFWYYGDGTGACPLPAITPAGSYAIIFFSEKSIFNFAVHDTQLGGTRYCLYNN